MENISTNICMYCTVYIALGSHMITFDKVKCKINVCIVANENLKYIFSKMSSAVCTLQYKR